MKSELCHIFHIWSLIVVASGWPGKLKTGIFINGKAEDGGLKTLLNQVY